MKKSLYIIAVCAFAAVSCQKDAPDSNEILQEGMLSVTADIAQFETDTKTSIDGTADVIKPTWSTGDEIILFSTDGTSAIYVVNPSDVGKSSASFSPKESAFSGTFAFAYYPAANATSYTHGTGVTATIPTVQAYTAPPTPAANAGTFANGSFPMVETGTPDVSGKNLNLSFKNVFGVLQLNFTSTTSEQINQIDLISTDNISGTATITTDAECSFAGGNKYLTLTMAFPQTLSTTATAFYIAVPANSAISKIYVTTGTGIRYKSKSITVTRSHIASLKSSTFAAAGFNEVVYDEAPDKTPVLLNGIVWAPVNCGYDASHTYGLLYQWGRTAGCGYSATEGMLTKTDAVYDDDGYNKDPDDNKIYIVKNVAPNDWYTNLNDASKQLPAWPMKSGDNGYVQGKIDNPCPAGWRVPTSTEMYSLTGGKDLGQTGYTYDAWDSTNKGFWFNGTANPVKNDGLFLPAAGYYHAGAYEKWKDWSPRNRDEIGYYWSSSVSSGTTNAGLRYLAPSKTIMDKAVRAHAMSVRCIHE